MKKIQCGFTLIELLIVIVIVGIISAVAYPSYMDSIRKVRREEAKRTLIEAAQQVENYYSMNLEYTGAVSGAGLTYFNPKVEFTDYYILSAAAPTASSFTLQAIPHNSQLNDSCGTLSINSNGATTAAVADCW